MKQHLQLLGRVPDISPMLALRSLAPFEWGSFESTDRCPELTVQSESDEPGASRRLLVDGAAVACVQYLGDNVDLQFEAAALPDDLRAVFAAIGIATAKGRSQLSAEQFYERICTVDAAWLLLRRIRNCTDAASAVPVAEQLLSLGLRWSQNQTAIVNHGETPAREKTAQTLRDEAAALRAANAAWMHALRLLEDPRGAAVEMRTRSFDHEFVTAALTFDWRPAPHIVGDPASTKTFGSGRYAVRPTKLKPAVLDALSSAAVSGNEVRIVQRLSKPLYAQVNDVLTTLGGRWHTGRQAHVFPEGADEVVQAVLASGEIFRREDFEFFWTPSGVARKVIQLAGLAPGMLCLEPSAGDGALAVPAAEIVGHQNVRVYELMPANVQRLRELGFGIERSEDFLAIEPQRVYDRCVMNPPFSGGRDVAHIHHAMRWLKPGGRLVAIASITWQQQSSAGADKFRRMLSDLQAEVIMLPRGEFKDAGTDVPTSLIAFNVPDEVEAFTPVAAPAAALAPRESALMQSRAGMEQMAFF